MARAAICTIAILIAGCYRSHSARPTGRDATVPPGVDAPIGPPPECMEEPGLSLGLECPPSAAVGEPIRIVLTHSARYCCQPDAMRATRVTQEGPTGVALEPRWDSCACCLPCECAGPSVDEGIVLGPFMSGPVHVRAGDLSCDIAIGDPSTCRMTIGGPVLWPAHVLDTTPIPIGLGAPGVSCGCSPEARADGLSGTSGEVADIFACGCSESDPCIDPGYEATIEMSLRPPGHYRFHGSSAAVAEVTVHSRTECGEAVLTTPRSISLAAPTDFFGDPAGPRATWVQVAGVQRRCCGVPELVVQGQLDGGSAPLTMIDCNPDLCDCADPRPVSFQANAFLGFVEPGSYSVSLLGTAQTIDVR